MTRVGVMLPERLRPLPDRQPRYYLLDTLKMLRNARIKEAMEAVYKRRLDSRALSKLPEFLGMDMEEQTHRAMDDVDRLGRVLLEGVLNSDVVRWDGGMTRAFSAAT